MIEPENPDFRLSGYDFDLPEELVAQSPSAERSGSRLMILRRDGGRTEQALFSDIVRCLPEGCLLVANNSRVVPARLTGKRPGGGRLEFLLLTPVPLLEPEPAGAEFFERLERRDEAKATPSCRASGAAGLAGEAAGEPAQARQEPAAPAEFSPEAARGAWQRAEAEGLLRPAKKIPPGAVLRLAPDFALRVLEHGPFGRCRTRIFWQGNLQEVLERRGRLPLPPYIRRDDRPGPDPDADRYQTVYARPDKAGSVAAPTAGLHFTPGLREELARSGRQWEEVTLYVGYGTFSPVRAADIREHVMHAEYAELPERVLAAVARAKAEGRPVIAVGTTSARVLEGVCELRPDLFETARPGRARAEATGFSGTPGRAQAGSEGEGGRTAGPEAGGPGRIAFAGQLSAFLYPGRPVRVVDGLITNFHLPRSSLLMLVSALAGRERVLSAYRRAVAGGFRFFSYGDAMLIL